MPLARAACWSRNTKYGQQFSKSRFVGLDLSIQIPNWLYDVTAIEGMRGPFAAGNHSVTEIQAMGLYGQMRRNDRIIEAPPTSCPDS